MKNKKGGFTLLELLVAMAVIGILASILFIDFKTAHDKSKTARVRADLHEFSTAVALLQADTGKWPMGCPPNAVEDPEGTLSDPYMGILTRPLVGNQPWYAWYSVCSWTPAEVAAWRGPYWKGSLDPWGNPYYIDPDYCDFGPTARSVLLSLGPDGQETYKADCSGFPPGLPQAYYFAGAVRFDPNSDDVILPIDNQ